MKKVVLTVLLGLILVVGGVFADHPDGWGLGVVGQFFGHWDGFGDRSTGGPGFSLKVPSLPIYWGLNLGFRSHYFGLALTGDYYIFDKPIVENGDFTFGWYLGPGGYFRFGHFSLISDWSYIDFGVRVPIGLSFQFLKRFEIFFDIAPSIGLEIDFGDDSGVGLGGGFGFDFGGRIWL
jgi:hypothetical protein